VPAGWVVSQVLEKIEPPQVAPSQHFSQRPTADTPRFANPDIGSSGAGKGVA
jgi:hypothetical protein